jgi:hypothetical protein
MKLSQHGYIKGDWHTIKSTSPSAPQLILCFGHKQTLMDTDWYNRLRHAHPDATIVAASTAGEISNEAIACNTIVATAIEFEQTKIVTAKVKIKEYAGSMEAGKALASQLNTPGLRFVFILSDGALVNGGDLIAGINDILPRQIPVAGGLAGDGPDFKSTVVGLNEDLGEGNIVAIGFYGDSLRIGFGSKGGWSEFGPTRTITRSQKNVLYEMDGTNALDLYKKYLGEHADRLPGSALLFPMALFSEEGLVVRTILSVDQTNKSMTFAGNMPQGATVRLMKTTLDDLTNAAAHAAGLSNQDIEVKDDKLSILISCVGRKLVFGNRIEEELDAARSSLGANTLLTGFYSYGEISPLSNFMKCQLHNQTMTITTLGEVGSLMSKQ